MFELNLGFDRGNKELKVAAIAGGRWHEYGETSVVGTVDLSHVLAITEGAGVAINLQDRALSFEGDDYLIGSLATQYSSDATDEFKDMNRYHGKRCKVALLTSATCIAQKLFPSIKEFKVNVVTGIPLGSYRDEEFRTRIPQELSGTYRYGFGGSQMTAHVIVHTVVLEGLGSALSTGALSQSGASVGVVDSGSRTTNLLLFNGLIPKLESCKTLKIGVGDALDALDQIVWRHYKRELDPLEQWQLLRAYAGSREYPDLYAMGKRIPAETWQALMAKVFAVVGEKRNPDITRVWGNDLGFVGANFSATIHSGGGALFFHETLQSLISSIQRVDRPEWGNARGYAMLADRIASSLPTTVARSA